MDYLEACERKTFSILEIIVGLAMCAVLIGVFLISFGQSPER
jgi:hypothetical protein